MGKEDPERGKVWVDVELSNDHDEGLVLRGEWKPERVRRAQVRALVDSGATMFVLPEETIRELGLAVRRMAQTRFADGQVCKRAVYGPVKIRVLHREMVTEVLTGGPGTPPLLGQIPLEGLDFLVDSKNQRLIPNPESPDPEMAMVDVF